MCPFCVSFWTNSRWGPRQRERNGLQRIMTNFFVLSENRPWPLLTPPTLPSLPLSLFVSKIHMHISQCSWSITSARARGDGGETAGCSKCLGLCCRSLNAKEIICIYSHVWVASTHTINVLIEDTLIRSLIVIKKAIIQACLSVWMSNYILRKATLWTGNQ